MKKISLCLSLLLLCPLNAPAADDCVSLAEAPLLLDGKQLRGIIEDFLNDGKIRYNHRSLTRMKKLGLSKQDIESVLRTTNNIVHQDDHGAFEAFRARGWTSNKTSHLEFYFTLTLENPQDGLFINNVRKWNKYPVSVVVDGQLLPVSQLSLGQFQQAVRILLDKDKIFYNWPVRQHMNERNISQEDIEYILRNIIQLKHNPQGNDPSFFQVIGSTREIPWLRISLVFSSRRKLIIFGAEKLE